MPATEKGKAYALSQLQIRRDNPPKPIDNSSLPAGAPMGFPRLTCAHYIWVPESYTSRPKLCSECQALKDMNWLE